MRRMRDIDSMSFNAEKFSLYSLNCSTGTGGGEVLKNTTVQGKPGYSIGL